MKREFKCPYCERTYSYKNGVILHIHRSHKMEWEAKKAADKKQKFANIAKIKNETGFT